MKRIFLIVALMATVAAGQSFAQDNQQTALLTSYYDIKNALVASDAAAAAAKSAEFLKLVNAIDSKSLPAKDAAVFSNYQNKLAFDARHISESKDLAHQREHFAAFSANFFKVAKSVKLSQQAIYYDYCPMNKTYWLSANKDIKNPYYGKQMLTCGKVSETIE